MSISIDSSKATKVVVGEEHRPILLITDNLGINSVKAKE